MKKLFKQKIAVIGIAILVLINAQAVYAQRRVATQQAAEPASLFWTGDGGRGMSITILPPRATGLAENQEYIPPLVQREIVSNFSNYSAVQPFNPQTVEEQYAELLSGNYSDNAQELWDLGHLPPTTHIMIGSITRTATGYALQISINSNADKMTVASYSGTFTFAELDNLSGVRRASLDLLQKMGVTPTERTRTELTRAAETNHANAQIANARGVTARTEVAALSYFIQAASLDSSLTEAVNRTSVMSANIRSGNVGMDTRNDIAWRRDWVTRLTETEEFFRTMITEADPPYSLFYSSGIERGAINYQTETTSFSFPVNLRANRVWLNSVAQAVNAVYAGLNATNKKNDWGLGNWPRQSLSSTNPFTARYDLSVVFELVNDQRKVIGRQTLRLNPSYSFTQGNNNQIVSNYELNNYNTVTFNNVNANDITDRLTIRVASVNNTVPENSRLRITALTGAKFNEYRGEYKDYLRVENGILLGFQRSLFEITYDSRTNYEIIFLKSPILVTLLAKIHNLVLPPDLWGEPFITSIADNAFSPNNYVSNNGFLPSFYKGSGITSVVIPNGVTYIGENSFKNQRELTNVIIPNSVTIIKHAAFNMCSSLTSIIIPDSVNTIESFAFLGTKLTSITIGANVTINSTNTFNGGFERFYKNNGSLKGTYTRSSSGSSRWTYTP